MNLRPVPWLLVGAAAGSAMTWWFMRGAAPHAPTALATPLASVAGGSAAATAPTPTAPTPTAPTPTAPTPTAPTQTAPTTASDVPPANADPSTLTPEQLMAWRLRYHGVTTSDEWWDGMPLDPAWDGAQIDRVRGRLRALGITVGADAVACRTRCCRIALPEDAFDRHADQLAASTGLRFGAAGGTATSNDGAGTVTYTTCWNVDDHSEYPDRAAERDRLIERTAAAVAACARAQHPRLTLKLRFDLDPTGEIAKLDSNAADLGAAAARCAERAVAEAAEFAAAPQSTTVYFELPLGT